MTMRNKLLIILTVVSGMVLYGCSGSSEKASLKISSGEHYLEYGLDPYDTEEEIHPEVMKFISSYKGELSVDYDEYDPFTLGEQTIYLTASTDEEEVEEELTVIVRDTTAPIIELATDTVHIPLYDDFDPMDNIVSVYDPAEDELEMLEFYDDWEGEIYLDEPMEDWGFYLANPFEVNVEEEGTYTVKLIAVDNHGNVTEGSYKVVVSENPEEDKDNPVRFQGEVKKQIAEENIPDTIQGILKEYCTDIGGEWDEGCVITYEAYEGDYEDWEEIDDAYEDDEDWDDEYYDEEEDWEDDEEYWDEDDEDWEDDDEYWDEDDEEWEDDEEDWDEEEDPEQDCYDMGGEWMPEAGGCAWPDDDEE